MKNQLNEYVFGKVQPHATDKEEAVLGALMLDKNAWDTVSGILTPRDFYTEAHAAIYASMYALRAKGQPVDLLTVMEQLKKDGKLEDAGGTAYLAELTHRVASAANIEYHARIILQQSIRRGLIDRGSEMIRKAHDPTEDELELLEQAEQGIFSITHRIHTGAAQGMAQVASKYLQRLEALRAANTDITGVPCGLTEIDNVFGGFQTPDLIIIAARPGMGKTAFMLTCARGAALRGNNVGVFSLEMSAHQLCNRLVSMESGLPTSASNRPAKMGAHEYARQVRATEIASELNIEIDDTAGISISALRSAARAMVKRGAKIIIVDYLQLMTAHTERGGNREQEISAISRGLKGMAKELGVPVIALSQLSRAVELRSDKKPQLSDLRESGAIEQDADVVSFLYRPEYYNIKEDEQGNSTKGICEFIIAKHRNGAVDTVLLRFNSETTTFYNYSQLQPVFATTFPADTPAMVGARSGDGDIPF